MTERINWEISDFGSNSNILKFKQVLEEREIEAESVQRLVTLMTIRSGLFEIHDRLFNLGELGKQKDTQNQFGDMALRADVESERIWLQKLTFLAETFGLKIHYIGEEVGSGQLGPDDGMEWSAFFDGIDGTDNYKNVDNVWPYGTMIALAPGKNPKYDDFAFSGIALEGKGICLTGAKDMGVFVTNFDSMESQLIHRFGQDEKYDTTKILADNHFPESRKNLGNKNGIWIRTGSQAASTGLIGLGEWQALVDVTGKGNLEQPATYLIIKELGGVMVTNRMESIGNKDFNTWGQNEKVLLITAKNQKIVKGIFKELSLI